MTFFFWLFISLIIYCYFGYPLLLTTVASFLRRPPRKHPFEPSLSVILSVWNEEDVIERKINNLLALDYPPEKMEILIGSDGSTDRTNAIIKQCADPRVRLAESGRRSGKMVTLNRLVEQARNEILVFTDARQDIDRSALRELTANLSDPAVGSVSGELVFSKKEGATARGINLYWTYEKFIRQKESDLHSMLGATGAIYAIRRELYSPIPAYIILDDVYIPFKIIQRGYRAVFDKAAKAYDEVADSPREEYRRKARTLSGNFQILRLFKGMFNPAASPIALQFFSHKFLRLMVPFLMVAVYAINLGLISERFYAILYVLQNVFYGMAVVGGLARHQKYGILKFLSRLCYIPYVFCLLNFSALAGFVRFVSSRQDSTWEKARK